MAEGGFFSRLFRLNDSDSEQENQNENKVETNVTEATGTTLHDVISFVSELQSYYYNDICKMQTNLIVQTGLTKSEVNFINKKIKQDQVALSQIDEIFDLIDKEERKFQSVGRKSVYSFYDEIEKAKLETVQKEVFEILLKLCEVNTKPELDSVIRDRIELYHQTWKIDTQFSIPKNYNPILVDGNNGIEEYRFGDFEKFVYQIDNEKVLSSKQLDKIRALKFEFEDRIQTDCVWVCVASVTRFQLNFMRRTCIIKNDWEHIPENTDKLYFDIVNVNDLEQYLKGILQIILSRKTYAVISIVVPTNDMLRCIGPIEQKEGKVEICKRYRFYLKERSGIYKNNLITARIDRRNIPEKLQFVSYLKFRELYF